MSAGKSVVPNNKKFTLPSFFGIINAVSRKSKEIRPFRKAAVFFRDFGFCFSLVSPASPAIHVLPLSSFHPRAYRAIGNNSETRSGKDFSDNGGPESCHRTFSASSRGAAAAAGALEINFGLMPRRRHREFFDVTTNSRCPRDVIFRISSAGFLGTIRASLATSQTYTSRINDPICEVRSDRMYFVRSSYFFSANIAICFAISILQ